MHCDRQALEGRRPGSRLANGWRRLSGRRYQRSQVEQPLPTQTDPLDWNCPPFQAEQLRWGLSNSAHIRVENAGHEQILPNPEIQDAIVRFLEGEAVPSDVVHAPPLRFVPITGVGDVTHPSVVSR